MVDRLLKVIIFVKLPWTIKLSAWYLLLTNLWGLVTSLILTGGTVGWFDKNLLTQLSLPPAPPLPPDLASSNPLSNFLLLLPYGLLVISLTGLIAAYWLLRKYFAGWLLTVILMTPIFISAAINFSHQVYPTSAFGWVTLLVQAAIYLYLIYARQTFR